MAESEKSAPKRRASSALKVTMRMMNALLFSRIRNRCDACNRNSNCSSIARGFRNSALGMPSDAARLQSRAISFHILCPHLAIALRANRPQIVNIIGSTIRNRNDMAELGITKSSDARTLATETLRDNVVANPFDPNRFTYCCGDALAPAARNNALWCFTHSRAL